MNNLLQKILVLLHLFLLVLFFIGPFLPGKYLIYYLFLWPFTYIHWHFNNSQCILTELEFKISGDFFNDITEYKHYSKNLFFSKLSKLNIYFSNVDSFDNFLDSSRSILWVIVFIRVLIYYRNNIVKGWNGVKKTFIHRFICEACKG